MRTLKFFLLFLIAFLCLASISNAQFHIGAKAGTNITRIDGKSFSEAFNYNYLLGGFAEIGVGRRFSISPEVIFSQSTSTLDSSYKSIYKDIIRSDQSRAKLNYLSIPVLAKLRLAGPLHIEAGPQFSVLMNSDKNFLQNGEEAFKRGDFSMVAGAQLKLGKLRIDGRYVVGLDNINKIDNKDEWKNQAIQLSIGLALF